MAIENNEQRKKWEEFSSEEKTSILNHWFLYYGGLIVTLEEVENFRKLAETKQDDIFNFITTSFLFQNTIQSNVLVLSMRQNKVDELFNVTLKIDEVEDEQARAQIEKARSFIVKEMVHTYLYPEPPVPLNGQKEEGPGMDF